MQAMCLGVIAGGEVEFSIICYIEAVKSVIVENPAVSHRILLVI